MNKKEGEEFAVMKNEITHIKTDVNEIKSMLKKHVDNEDKILGGIDVKYATKERVKQLETKFDTWNTNQDTIIKSRADKLWDIVKILLPYIAFGTLFAIMAYGPKGV